MHENGFLDFLRSKDLAETTVKRYASISRRWGDQDPVEWLRSVIGIRTPLGTACSYQAAVRKWLEFKGLPHEERLLPKAKRSQRSYRDALTEEELEQYIDAIEHSSLDDPYYTILYLLPLTGMRISEVCKLERNAFKRHGRVLGLDVVRKRTKVHWLAVGEEVDEQLQLYLRRNPSKSTWLFPSPKNPDNPASPVTARQHLRGLREQWDGYLREVTPHVLRHTAATRLLEAGTDLATLKEVMGHENIETTARYLHPSATALLGRMNQLSIKRKKR